MNHEGFPRSPELRRRRWFHELPGDPYTVDGSAVVWPPSDCGAVAPPLVIPGQRRSPED